MEELRFQQKVEGIVATILGLENRSKSSVMANDTQFALGLKEPLAELNKELHAFDIKTNNPELLQKFQEFKKIANARTTLSNNLIDTFHIKGQTAAELLIKANKALLLERSLVMVGRQLTNMRQQSLGAVIQNARENGDRAKTFGYLLALFAVGSSILAFWYISNKIAEQQRIIEALNASERKIREASRMKEQFMANISHEIRTPMNAILGFTSLLKRSKLNPEQTQFVDNIHSSGENLLTLINDILDLSKIEAGMMGLEETQFSLRSLVASIRGMFFEKTKKKGLQLQVEIDEKIPDILAGDSVRLTQILVNLLGNAIKFTEKGGVKLGFDLLSQVNNKVRLKIIVADSGIGIPKEKQALIFERFHQADLDTTRRFGGTGLGLSIVKQLVELQGGSIQLRSKPGSGSLFCIELEYIIPDEPGVEADSFVHENTNALENKVKVLIAEDNVMNQQLIRHLMKNWQIDAVIVDNGKEAVSKLKDENFSLVLMDIQMPQMDGYTATEIIRNELGSSIPIVAMTAHAMTGEKEKCLEIGMNDYISKPLNENILYNMISQYAQFQEGDENNGNLDPRKEQITKGSEMHLKYIDLVYLRELSGNDREFEKQMLQQITVQAPMEIEQLEQAIKAGDFLNAKKIAHSLKSTVGYIGLAPTLHPHLERIEKSALSAKLEEVVDNFVHVKQVMDEAVKEVREFLKTL
jgi:signal transduction histidine kinase/DNA-binding response OmpR family regulator